MARQLFPLQIASSLESKAKAKLVRLHQDIFSCSISSLETPAWHISDVYHGKPGPPWFQGLVKVSTKMGVWVLLSKTGWDACVEFELLQTGFLASFSLQVLTNSCPCSAWQRQDDPRTQATCVKPPMDMAAGSNVGVSQGGLKGWDRGEGGSHSMGNGKTGEESRAHSQAESCWSR